MSYIFNDKYIIDAEKAKFLQCKDAAINESPVALFQCTYTLIHLERRDSITVLISDFYLAIVNINLL